MQTERFRSTLWALITNAMLFVLFLSIVESTQNPLQSLRPLLLALKVSGLRLCYPQGPQYDSSVSIVGVAFMYVGT